MYTLMITAPEGTVKHRTLLFFGEHPREMISVELGAHFLKQLCDKLLMGDAQTISLLRAHEIYLVPIANPSGRSLLEGGDLCVRSNAAGVDINRNWDIEWRQGDEGDKFTQTFPGDAPFSEEETRALRDLMQEVKPQLFISIHSGQAAILTPYAYTAEQPSWMSDKWSEILSKLSQDCPACTIGSAARVLNYRGYGTSLDYAYKRLRIPYTFAFEIYDGFRYYNRLLRHQKKAKKEEENESNILSPAPNIEEALIQDSGDCFRIFNPTKRESLQFELQRWNGILLDAISRVGREL